MPDVKTPKCPINIFQAISEPELWHGFPFSETNSFRGKPNTIAIIHRKGVKAYHVITGLTPSDVMDHATMVSACMELWPLTKTYFSTNVEEAPEHWIFCLGNLIGYLDHAEKQDQLHSNMPLFDRFVFSVVLNVLTQYGVDNPTEFDLLLLPGWVNHRTVTELLGDWLLYRKVELYNPSSPSAKQS